MSHPLPRPPAPSGALALLLVLAALLSSEPASSMDLTVSAPRERNGYVYVDARVGDPFVPRIEESLARGMPATLEVQCELWRRRNGWFDRLESRFRASVRIRYEVWGDHYRLERAGTAPLRVSTIDSVASLLSRPWSVPAGRIGQLVPSARYYVVVHAVLKPLSVEDVQEVEGWLSGEVKSQGRAGLGVITELPRALFDTVRNFAGFGDRRTRSASPEFELGDLFPNRMR